MIRIVVDRTRCFGYGNCVAALSEVFDLNDEDGVVLVDEEAAQTVAERQLDAAVRSCPTNALRINRT
ncbi:ferredoxin [Rhizomonospora bruguierae]|uniref:ferredoxin n=1 Tax=Rhizomonospora bruguierae TaxID=1581705 RepID=UPI001BD089DB|nr:ferredoxin [Micromonospora sp. NBRC 107566]